MKTNITPSSGTAVDLMRMGVPYENLPELTQWVSMLARLTKKDNAAYTDEFYSMFARRGDSSSRLSILNAVMEYGGSVPERILAYPFFENFVNNLAEDGRVDNRGTNIYFADYEPDEIIMTLCMHAWKQSGAIFGGKKDADWHGDTARIMCLNSAASLYLSMLYDLKHEYNDNLSEADREKLAADVARGRYSRKYLGEKVAAEEKYTPFICRIMALNLKAMNQIYQNCVEINAAMPKVMDSFNATPALTKRERDNAIGRGWEFVSFCYQSVKVAGAIKEIGYDTFRQKAEDISRKIDEMGGAMGKKKPQLVAKIASGNACDLDYEWLRHIDLLSRDPFGFNVSEADKQNQQVFALACNAAKEGAPVQTLMDRIGEQIKSDARLSSIGATDERGSMCANAVFFAVGKALITGLTKAEEDEGVTAWQHVKDCCKQTSGQFMRQ